LSHPTTYYSNSTSGYSTSWQKSTVLNTDSLLFTSDELFENQNKLWE
jgi:hypothetical protein